MNNEEYAASGVMCPICGHDSIEPGEVLEPCQPRQVHLTCTCMSCFSRWTEIYTLTGFTIDPEYLSAHPTEEMLRLADEGMATDRGTPS